MRTKHQVSHNLARLRRISGFGQEDMSWEIGCSTRALQGWESENSALDREFERYQRMADFFGLDLPSLLRYLATGQLSEIVDVVRKNGERR